MLWYIDWKITYNKYVVEVRDQIHESAECSPSRGIDGEIWFSGVEAKRSSIAQILPLEIGYNETEPCVVVILRWADGENVMI